MTISTDENAAEQGAELAQSSTAGAPGASSCSSGTFMTLDSTCSHETPVVDLKHRQSARAAAPAGTRATSWRSSAVYCMTPWAYTKSNDASRKRQRLAVGDGHGRPGRPAGATFCRVSADGAARRGPRPSRARRPGQTARPQLRRRNRRLIRRVRARRRNRPGAAGGAASRSGRRRGRRRSRDCRPDACVIVEVVNVRVPVRADARVRRRRHRRTTIGRLARPL